MIYSVMKKGLLILLVVFVGFSLYGCSQSPVTSTTSTTTTVYTTFLGVNIGDSATQVTTELGTPEYLSTSSLYFYNTYQNLITFNGGVVTKITTSAPSGYTLAGINIGDTSSKVKSLLGTPSSTKTGTSGYSWIYSSMNIAYGFTSSDIVSLMGVMASGTTW